MFILHTSKTHWKDVKPQIVKINSLGKVKQSYIKQNEAKYKDSSICPFTILQNYLQVRKKRNDDTEQFFVFSDRTPVEPNHMRAVLKAAVKLIGLNSDLYSVSGFRSGRASDLVSMKIDLPTVKFLGRWKSNAVYTYLRH